MEIGRLVGGSENSPEIELGTGEGVANVPHFDDLLAKTVISDYSKLLASVKLPDYSALFADVQVPDYTKLFADVKLPDYSALFPNVQVPDYTKLFADVKLPDFSALVTSVKLPTLSALLASVKLPDYSELFAKVKLPDYSELLGYVEVPDYSELLAKLPVLDYSNLLANVGLPDYSEFVDSISVFLNEAATVAEHTTATETSDSASSAPSWTSLELLLAGSLTAGVAAAHHVVTVGLVNAWTTAMLFLRLAAWAQANSPELQGLLFIFGLIGIVQVLSALRRAVDGKDSK